MSKVSKVSKSPADTHQSQKILDKSNVQTMSKTPNFPASFGIISGHNSCIANGSNIIQICGVPSGVLADMMRSQSLMMSGLLATIQNQQDEIRALREKIANK